MEKKIKKDRYEKGGLLSHISKIYYILHVPFGTKLKAHNMNKSSIKEAKEGNKELTILLHGIAANYYQTMFGILKWFKKRKVNIVSVGYDYRKHPAKEAEKVKREIARIMKKADVKKVNIVGISQGGLIARYYAEKLNGKKHIDKLVTVYTPLKPVNEKRVGFRLNKLLGGHPELSNEVVKKIQNKFSVKNHLAIYGMNDKIIGKQYPIPKKIARNIKQVGIRGGHTFVSFNPEAMKIALKYLKEEKV